MYATRPTHLILHVIILVIQADGYQLQTSSSFFFL